MDILIYYVDNSALPETKTLMFSIFSLVKSYVQNLLYVHPCPKKKSPKVWKLYERLKTIQFHVDKCIIPGWNCIGILLIRGGRSYKIKKLFLLSATKKFAACEGVIWATFALQLATQQYCITSCMILLLILPYLYLIIKFWDMAI